MRRLFHRRSGCIAERRIVAVSLVIGGVLLALATPHATDERRPFSIEITSPLGRTGLPGTVRIVARITVPAGAPAPSAIRFYVNDALVGNDADGPPYAVEWTDANPFEPTRIRVEATDALGNAAADAIDLAPFEIVDTTAVSQVLLEATVVDKADRFVGGLDAASFRVLENEEPQTIDLASIESMPVCYTLLVDASQSMHARMEFVRAAAGRLADFLRPKDRIIVAPFAQSLGAITGPTNDRETIAGAVRAISAKGGTAIADGLIEASRLAAGAEGRHVIVLITDGYDENSQTKMEDALLAHSRRTPRYMSLESAASPEFRSRESARSGTLPTRPVGVCFFRRGRASCRPCTSSWLRTCSSGTLLPTRPRTRLPTAAGGKSRSRRSTRHTVSGRAPATLRRLRPPSGRPSSSPRPKRMVSSWI